MAFHQCDRIEEIDHKMRNFLHHLEYEESGYDLDKLKSLINNRKVMYDHKADKKILINGLKT